MLKRRAKLQSVDSNREFERRLTSILGEIPFLELGAAKVGHREGPDLCLDVQVAGKHWILLCEFKRNTELRNVRSAVYQLRHFLGAVPKKEKYAILIGPYFAAEAANLLRKESIGFADLAGNCLLTFDKVYIERTGARNPFTATRRQRSLFAPKTARVLVTLLQEPSRRWGTVELAAASHVSPGQVSNIKKALMDREWAQADRNGVRLTNARVLLDAWRSAYQKRTTEQSRYYTPLHGKSLDEAIRAASKAAHADAVFLLCSTSAARWMAPFVRDNVTRFYADKKGEDLLREHLKLELVSRGENVIVEAPADDGVFLGRIEVAPGLWATNLIQTYLDLTALGERGQEAAEHLRTTKIDPMLSKQT